MGSHHSQGATGVADRKEDNQCERGECHKVSFPEKAVLDL